MNLIMKMCRLSYCGSLMLQRLLVGWSAYGFSWSHSYYLVANWTVDLFILTLRPGGLPWTRWDCACRDVGYLRQFLWFSWSSNADFNEALWFHQKRKKHQYEKMKGNKYMVGRSWLSWSSAKQSMQGKQPDHLDVTNISSGFTAVFLV